MYEVRNRFQQGLAAEVGGPGPLRSTVLSGTTQADAARAAAGPVTGSGPGYAAANIGENRFLPNGKAQLSANDPDAERLYAKNPNMYEKAPAKPKQPALSSQSQGQPRQAAGMPNDAKVAYAGDNPISLSQWMINQLQSSGKGDSDWQVFAKGGQIREPIMGIGASGKKYLFGEAGNETVTPNDQLKNNDDSELIAEIQKVLGRRIFQKSKKPLKKSGLYTEDSDQNQNTVKAVNAPVLRINEDDVRELAKYPQFGKLLSVLAQAEKRGGISVEAGGEAAQQASAVSPMSSSEVSNEATPNEQIAAQQAEDARRAEEESNFLPQFNYADESAYDPTAGTYDPGISDMESSTTNNAGYDTTIPDGGQITSMPEMSDLESSTTNSTMNTYEPSAGTFTPEPSDTTNSYNNVPSYGAGSYDPSAFQPSAGTYSPPPSDYSSSVATPQQFDQSALDKMLADALARSGYQPGAGTYTPPPNDLADPYNNVPQYGSQSYDPYAFDPSAGSYYEPPRDE